MGWGTKVCSTGPGADPGFLDWGFNIAEGGFDFCSLTNFS